MDDHHHYHHTNMLSNPSDHHHISPLFSMLEQDFVNIPLIHYQSYHEHNHHNFMQINGVFKDEAVALPDPDLIVDMSKADTDDNRVESEEVDHASPNHGGGKARNVNVKLKAKSSAGSAAKQKKAMAHKRVLCVPASTAHDHSKYATVECLHSDSWAWRKYGQKPIKGSPFPRAYYRCSSSKGCTARKQVERSKADPSMLVITYSSEHNHALPTPKGSHSKYVKKLESDESRPIMTMDSTTTPAYTPHIKSPDHSLTSTLNNGDSPHEAPSSSSSSPPPPHHIPSSPTVTNTEDAAAAAATFIDPNSSELRQDPDPDDDYNSILRKFLITTKTDSTDRLDPDITIDQFSSSSGDPFNLLHWTSGYDYLFES